MAVSWRVGEEQLFSLTGKSLKEVWSIGEQKVGKRRGDEFCGYAFSTIG